MRLKLLTVNCWGIPYSIPTISSPDRRERLDALADFLLTGGYTFVFLQELWLPSDFDELKVRVKPCLPFSAYYRTGTIGSGTAILSRHPLSEITTHPYTVNGFPHQIWRGDALAGSGLGLASVQVSGRRLLLAVTHLHAEYYGEFLADRTCQSLQLASMVSHLARGVDLLLLAGDFNSLPGELPHRIVSSSALDSWQGRYQPTYGHPSNSYTATEEEETLDYIFYRNIKVEVINVCLPLLERFTDGRVPGETFSFTDHEAVEVELNFSISNQEEEEKEQFTMTKADKINATDLLKESLAATKQSQFRYLMLCLLCLFTVLFIDLGRLSILPSILFCFSLSMALLTLQQRITAFTHVLTSLIME